MAKTYLTIITVDNILFKDDVDAVQLRTKAGGEIVFLPNHTPFCSNIDVCKMTVFVNDKNKQVYSVGSGLVYADAKDVYIISDDVIAQTDIDIERARSDRDLFTKMVSDAKTEKDRKLSEFKLRKALSRIDIYNQK
ncbi:FoF1 ATP synthase subunit delta/epsilon [Mycoplasmopsis columbinasalis]|uniref:ATP synthase epsilon chain n=1 Tax=Mycoplasmopsis columbinasalis TaxID=114880 RepID=A0A449B9W3_9BACT|nr:F0F1 ATP synthase subunit epsilon [Mycoplasmopsis columbinasalis]VEU77971.1 ATP synthase epsilon chain [Mycoplasmopsis columbinasalis]